MARSTEAGRTGLGLAGVPLAGACRWRALLVGVPLVGVLLAGVPLAGVLLVGVPLAGALLAACCWYLERR